jgi:hypothetical protein
MQLVKPGYIDCQQIVLNQATVFGLIAADDGEIIILYQLIAMRGNLLAHVSGTSLFDDVGRNS